MDFYLGMTGLPGAGKEAVAKLIAAELAAHNIQTLHYSLSGPITLELQRRGLPPDREQMRTVANELRASLGNGAWAARTAREIRETLTVREWPLNEGAINEGAMNEGSVSEGANVFVMIDGVRNPAEVAVFKELWGSRFHLLAVNAPEEVRRRNLTARSSPKDAAVLRHLTLASAEDAEANNAGPASSGADNPALAPVLTAEMGIGQPQHGTNVVACIELADWTLDNAEHDATMRALRAEVRSFVKRLVLPLYSVETTTVREGEAAPVADASGSVGSVGVSTVREGPRALVVESDPAWQARLADLLALEGCTVEFAATYAEASHKLLAQPSRSLYQLITVDLHLPGTASEGHGERGNAGGYDLLQSLHYFDRTLPAIIVTEGAAAEQVSRAFRDFGVRDAYAKHDFTPQALRARVRELLQTPFYVVAMLEAGAADYLLVDRPCTLSLRIQRGAPLHRPPLCAVRRLLRPSTAADWPITVVAGSPDLRLDAQPASLRLHVPANCLAEPLTFTLTAHAAGNGRIELQFHQPGEFVDWLALDVSVRME